MLFQGLLQFNPNNTGEEVQARKHAKNIICRAIFWPASNSTVQEMLTLPLVQFLEVGVCLTEQLHRGRSMDDLMSK